jgi:16S rRNA (uracil1498-N3)-methyltransferase
MLAASVQSSFNSQMHTIRIYINNLTAQPMPCTIAADKLIGAEISLDAALCHRLQHVMRLAIGAKLVLFDGSEYEYQVHLCKYNKKQALVKIDQQILALAKATPSYHLYQAIARSEHMDYALQKACELGVASIQPVITDHSQLRLKQSLLQKKQAHWQAVIIAACEQCGRGDIPELHPPLRFEQALQRAAELSLPDAQRIFCACGLKQQTPLLSQHLLEHKANLSHEQTKAATYQVFIGAEGGFSEAEVALATQMQWSFCQLGARTLRSETATSVALALLQFLG